jgi:hypothetical protein
MMFSGERASSDYLELRSDRIRSDRILDVMSGQVISCHLNPLLFHHLDYLDAAQVDLTYVRRCLVACA